MRLDLLKQHLAHQTLPKYRYRIQEFKKHHAANTVANIHLSNLFNGLHNVPILFHPTSILDKDDGVLLRGYRLKQVQDLLHKPKGCFQPSIESVFWLLITGELPTHEQIESLTEDLRQRAKISLDAINFLQNLPIELPPMTQLSMGLLYLQKDSIFRKNMKSVAKESHWELTYEDGLEILAKIPLILEQIYHKFTNIPTKLHKDSHLDWCGRLAQSLSFSEGISEDFIRLFTMTHIDHEGGNVSTHTTMAVASTLADPYLSLSSGINGLAGPLHGMANRDVVLWLMELESRIKDFKNSEGVKEDIRSFVNEKMGQKKNIPGFGHSILRKVDARFSLFKGWSDENIKEDYPLVKLAGLCGEVIPEILTKKSKVKNPWPNVDLHSGVLLHYFGMKNPEFYPVFFAAARSFGCIANLVLERAIQMPIEYPLSFDVDSLEKLLKEKES